METGDIDPLDLVKSQSRSAALWARSFMNGFCNDLSKIDEGLMLGWFANAMMAMHDSIYNNEIKLLRQKEDKLKSLLLLTDASLLAVISDEDKVCGGTVQLAQWQEFIKEFPDEA